MNIFAGSLLGGLNNDAVLEGDAQDPGIGDFRKGLEAGFQDPAVSNTLTIQTALKHKR